MKNAQERGTVLLDATVGIIIAGIVTLGLAKSAIVSYRYSHKAVSDSRAVQLVNERLEELSRTDPQLFVDEEVEVESSLQREGITFERTTTYSINPDRSRTAAVRVRALRPKLPTDVTIENTFYLWGER